MGNCLKGASADDISLLRGNEGATSDNLNIESAPDGMPVYYPEPNETRSANQLSEEEQLRIARRIGLMEHLPILAYDEAVNKHKECVICMAEFKTGERVRYLPCVHVYHVSCIDGWLMRSFTCPSCMEPVDAALLTSYNTTTPPTVGSNTVTTTTPATGYVITMAAAPSADDLSGPPVVSTAVVSN